MLLSLEEVTKKFGGLTALDNVSLKMDSGEAVGIVGPNGSGKTTLYNVINGVYLPDKGRVVFEGLDLKDSAPHIRARTGIARTFQIPRPFASSTVQENVVVGALFGRARADLKEALQIADHYLELVGLIEKAEVEAKMLTSTEKKLMEIARALAMKPKLLLLDEPMAGMNPKDIGVLIKTLEKVRREEKVALMSLVEHLMHAVSSFAERVVVMNQGKKFLEGPPQEVLHDERVIEMYLGRGSAHAGR